jgi:23S rRNA-/tRNA-specific pseudouridylate synthase
VDVLPAPKAGVDTLPRSSSSAVNSPTEDASKSVTTSPAGAEKAKVVDKTADEAATSSPTGRFGLGALELLALDDEDEEEEPAEKDEEVDKVAAPEAGWDALKALIEEDDEEEDATVGQAEENEQASSKETKAEDAKKKEDAPKKTDTSAKAAEKPPAAEKAKAVPPPPKAKAASGTSAPAVGSRALPRKSERDISVIEDDDEMDEDSEEGDEDDKVGSDEEEDESSVGGVSELSDDQDSYKGSDLDPLDCEDSDASGSDNSEMNFAGLLGATFSGGSLHSEEGRGKGSGRDGRAKKPCSIRVVFPSLIWRGKDMLVVNKPADWVCSASDVDKKKGRALDPNEKVAAKGFKALPDLLNYQFVDREKKYIHWWIQLLHDLDEESYPNLFDEDQNYGLCHRLDRETSGTVLVGLTQLARQQMRECFHRHYVRKLYVCLVHGSVEPAEQTIDRNLEAMGQKARLHANGKRSRTHVKVLGYYSRTKDGQTEQFSLCTCEIAEGRMHQIRLHMSGALSAPIVSEFYYQETKQMVEDRKWCQRVFLHAYAVGFPDVSGSKRRVGSQEEEEDRSDVDAAGLIADGEKMDTEQEWHACICPLTVELRDALKDLKPKDETAEKLRDTITVSGLLDTDHEEIHVMGTETRKNQIDTIFFPWSSQVNPIEVGDINKPRDVERARAQERPGGQLKAKGGGRGRGRSGNGDPAALRPKAKPRRAARRCDGSVSPRSPGPPRRHERRLRKRVVRCGRSRSPGGLGPPLRSRSPGLSPPAGQLPPPRQVRRCARSRSGPVRRRCGRSLSGRRPPGAPPSPRRSMSPAGPAPRRKRRRVERMVSPGSGSPLMHRGGGPPGPRGPRRRGVGGGGGFGGGGGGGFGGTGGGPGISTSCEARSLGRLTRSRSSEC